MKWGELRGFGSAGLSGRAAAFGRWGRNPGAGEVEFAAVEEFPLNFFAGRQADGCGQG